jgi:hypothetical protein
MALVQNGRMPAQASERGKRVAAWVVAIALLALPCAAVHAQSPGGGGVPVTTATAKRQDFDVYLHGLGQVQALNSVLVRARVDGTLQQVPVKEGQMVKTGDLLAVIDPRPYQSALDQANAKLAQDQADLANAKLDLARYANLVKQDFASHQLRLYPVADRGAHRAAPGRSGQHDPLVRGGWDHDDHPGAADRGHVHAAAGPAAAGDAGDGGGAGEDAGLFR